MTDTNLARTVITLNASFSLVTGIALTLFPSAIASLLFNQTAAWQYWVILLTGLGLIPFAIFLLILARNPEITRFQVTLVIDADIAWVVASFIVLLVFPNLFTLAGKWIIALAALAVASFAFGQFQGARRIKSA